MDDLVPQGALYLSDLQLSYWYRVLHQEAAVSQIVYGRCKFRNIPSNHVEEMTECHH